MPSDPENVSERAKADGGCSATVRELIEEARITLAGASDSAELDAEVLLAAALNCGRSRLYAWPEWVPTDREAGDFRRSVLRRASGLPVAYLLGEREFWGLDLQVSRATLIPRPETELLVELALRHIAPERSDNVADLGTGSGAVALALAKERPGSRIFACDLCEEALSVAGRNARRLGIRNASFHQGDWFDALPSPRKFDVVVSNPPYVAEADPALADLSFEPRTALVAGPDGLDAIRRIVADAPGRLHDGAWLLIEHGATQGPGVRALLQQKAFQEVATAKDLAGLERISFGRNPATARPRESV